MTQDPAILDRDWTFLPSVEPGSTVKPGSIVGTVPNAGSVEHRVLVPWGVAGDVTWVAPRGTVHAQSHRAVGGDAVARAGAPADSCVMLLHVRSPLNYFFLASFFTTCSSL